MKKAKLMAQSFISRASDVKGKVVAGATLGYVSVVNAAPVELPATAQTDAVTSATNGGNFMIEVVLVVLGFGIIVAMVKKAK